jgi:hypothetical protein
VTGLFRRGFNVANPDLSAIDSRRCISVPIRTLMGSWCPRASTPESDPIRRPTSYPQSLRSVRRLEAGQRGRHFIGRRRSDCAPVSGAKVRFERAHFCVRLSIRGARRSKQRNIVVRLLGTNVGHWAGLNRTGIGVNSTTPPHRANLASSVYIRQSGRGTSCLAGARVT